MRFAAHHDAFFGGTSNEDKTRAQWNKAAADITNY